MASAVAHSARTSGSPAPVAPAKTGSAKPRASRASISVATNIAPNTRPTRSRATNARNGSPSTRAPPSPWSNQQPSTNYRDRVSEAYTRIETAKDNLLRECVKFGALLTEVGYYLGETQGKKGEGLQAWLSENCPEVNYSTAMNYKALAGKCVKMLGGGSQAVAVLQDKTEVIPPGEDEAVEVESKFIEKRDELFNEVKSRRELEQTYFKFMASEGKGKRGRPVGTTKPVPENYAAAHKTNAENAATAYAILWKELDKKRQLPNLASLLSIEDARSIHELMKPVFEALRKRVGEAE